MWRVSSKRILLYLILVIVLIERIYKSLNVKEVVEEVRQTKKQNYVTIVAVACGESWTKQIATMVKSALVFSTHPIRFVLITETPLFDFLRNKLESFKNFYNFTFLLKEVRFPEGNDEDWRNLLSPCTTQRLFLPSLLLNDSDLVLYVDSDTIFLSPPHDIFAMLHQFNSKQFAAFSPESQDNNSWYPKSARHPFYGSYGLNSGVALMNLSRMREIEWERQVVMIYEQYSPNLCYYDQDIINIYFHFHPDEVFALQCEYNYRSDQCEQGIDICPTAIEGVKIIHGSRRAFENLDSIFGQIYSAFQEVKHKFVLNQTVFNILYFSINLAAIHVA